MISAAEDSGLRCLECDYNITGLQGSRCPECGWCIDLGLATLAMQRESSHVNRLLTCGLGGVGAMACCLLLYVCSASWGSTFALLLGTASIAAVLHCAVAVYSLPVFEQWPIERPRLRLACRVSSIAHLLATVLLLATGTLRQLQGLIEFIILFWLIGAPGVTLFLLSLVAFRSRAENLRQLRELRDHPPAQPQYGVPFSVEAAGRFSREEVTVVSDEIKRRTNDDIQGMIEQVWQAKQEEAAGSRCLLYNSVIGRLTEASVEEDRLVLRLGETDYRDFVGTNLFNAGLVRAYGEEFLANPLGTSATIITSDGYILYGRRGDRVVYHVGCLHTFGGTLEAEDRTADQSYDLWGAITRELFEEAHLEPGEILELVCTGLVRDALTLQPELLFDAHVSLTRREVLSRFDPKSDEEHTAIESCHDLPEAIVPFIQRSQPVVPVAVGAMMLHGAASWGHDWYESTAYVLFGELPPRCPR